MAPSLFDTNKTRLWLSILVSSLLPVALGLALTEAVPEWKWSHYPFHSMLESMGSLSALTIATLMIIMVRHGHLSSRYLAAAGALVGMGLLDGFHAVLHVGVSFVWLHSVATMVGGLLFACVWFPSERLPQKQRFLLLYSIIPLALFIGFAAILIPESVPPMVVDGHFTLLAIILNFGGGLGFLMGAVYFVHAYKENTQAKKISDICHNESIVFANHCVLFGIAGLLFEMSSLWDAGWWLWHVLRFVAYEIVLVYFFVLFKKGQDALVENERKLEELNQELENRVRERTFELERASRAKSEFLSRMSHELRTPLNAILGFSQLLELDKCKMDESQRENVQEIDKAGKHLLAMVNEVLDLNRIETGRIELHNEFVDVLPVIQECIAQVRPIALQFSLQIYYQASEPELVAWIDKIRFRQVILNLLSNAIKYNRQAGEVHVSCSKSAGDQVRVVIKDTGIGIEEASLGAIFEPFERLGDTNAVEGSGIGLALARRLVLAMKGNIGVESRLGEGSTFWIELPANC